MSVVLTHVFVFRQEFEEMAVKLYYDDDADLSLFPPRCHAIVPGNRPSDEANVGGASTQPSQELVEVLCDRKTVAD